MTLDAHDDASISPRGRFERMEAALSRIEDKLDTKAEQSAHVILERQVSALERIDSNRLAAAEALRVEKETTAAALKEVSEVRDRSMRMYVGAATFISMAISATVAMLSLFT